MFRPKPFTYTALKSKAQYQKGFQQMSKINDETRDRQKQEVSNYVFERGLIPTAARAARTG